MNSLCGELISEILLHICIIRLLVCLCLQKCVTALEKTWHTEHFFCAQCGKQFGEDGFHEREGKPYCKDDYFNLFAPKCGACFRPIMENYVSALSSQWHSSCFVCRVGIFWVTIKLGLWWETVQSLCFKSAAKNRYEWLQLFSGTVDPLCVSWRGHMIDKKFWISFYRSSFRC